MKRIRDFIVLITLILLQSLVFNNFLFFGYLNPYIYVYWIISRNNEDQRALMLILAFILGGSIDILEGSGGMHALSTTLLAYLQPFLWRVFQNSSDHDEDQAWLAQLSFERKLPFIFSAFFLHHFCLFLAENFGFNNVGILIQRSLYSSLFSFIFVGIYQFWKFRR